MEQEKLNIFYRPNIAPDQSYESVSAFSEIVSSEIAEEQKTVTEDFVKITKSFIELFNSFKQIPDELGFMLSEINYPILEYLVSYTTERIESEEESSDEDESGASEDSGSEYEVITSESPDDINIEDDEEDEIFIVEVAQDNFKTSVSQAKDAYENDLSLLKKEYISQMNQVITKYFIDITKCTNSLGMLDDSYLLQDIDADAVVLKDEKQRYIKDSIIKSQIEKENKMLLFSKTHTQENTLIYLRGLIAADALRRRYCESEPYEIDSSAGYAEQSSLRSERDKQDFKYSQAIKEYYKYLKSMSIIASDILSATVKEAELKTSLIQSGVDIYKKVDNQATDSSGNTNTKLNTEANKTNSSNTNSIANKAESIFANTITDIIGNSATTDQTGGQGTIKKGFDDILDIAINDVIGKVNKKIK